MYIINIKSLNKRLKLDIPSDTPKGEAIEYAFKQLKETGKDPEALEYIGNQLETSGWGKTIGGAIGSIGGAAAGVFTAPFTAGVVNPITGAVGGGAAGGAAGEAIEQWLTHRGDGGDVGKAALTEGAWGLLPAGGAAVKGGLKVAAKPAINLLSKTVAPVTSRLPGFGKVTEAVVEQFTKGASKLGSSDAGKVISQTITPVYDGLRKEIVDLTKRKSVGLTSSQTKRLASLKQTSKDLELLKDTVLNVGYGSEKNVQELLGVLKKADGLLGSNVTEEIINNISAQTARNATVKGVSKGAAVGEGAAGIAKGMLDQDDQDELAESVGLKGLETVGRLTPFLNKGGLLKDKISKVYNEGYTAPGQAYAIAKSYQRRGLLNK